MSAHFVRHVYHRHSHDTYSFGVTEQGAQAFRCRGASHCSTAGLVMTFNPDDPHDGQAGDPGGFTYQMVHLDPQAVRETLVQAQVSRPGLPLFTAPVGHHPRLAQRVRLAADLLLTDAEPLAAQEAIDALVLTAAGQPPAAARTGRRPARAADGPGQAVRELMHSATADRLTAADLAQAAGANRFQVYRWFQQVHGLAPSAYLRQLRLREARRALAAGTPVAAVATAVGFADQAHLTRWFRRTYGITPATYQRAAGRGNLAAR